MVLTTWALWQKRIGEAMVTPIHIYGLEKFHYPLGLLLHDTIKYHKTAGILHRVWKSSSLKMLGSRICGVRPNGFRGVVSTVPLKVTPIH